jgi:hypothetical protein
MIEISNPTEQIKSSITENTLFTEMVTFLAAPRID